VILKAPDHPLVVEAVNRLDLAQTKESTTYQDLVRGGSKEVSEGGTEGAIEGVKKELHMGDGKGDDEQSTERKSGEQKKQAERAQSARGEGGQRGGGERRSRGGQDEEEDSEQDDEEDGGGKGKGLLSRVTDRAKWS